MLEHYIKIEKVLLWAHIRGVKDAAPIRSRDIIISSADKLSNNFSKRARHARMLRGNWYDQHTSH